jgi:hypothetical protein
MSRINRTRFVITLLAAAVLSIGCGGSPSSPSASSSVSVNLSATTIAPGSSVQGTVTVSAPMASAASVALTSSNSSVATVQATVTIQSGSSTATFNVTGVAVGTTTIQATVNGVSGNSPPLTVAGTRVVLASISLSASTVVGGNSLTATATLTAPAPDGGAVVSLSAADPITVPGSVTVPAVATSTTFQVNTRKVGGTISGAITGSYGGASASASLSVTKPTVATAAFGVTGPNSSDTCTLTNNGTTLDCTFNGATSDAPGNIVAWDWTYTVASTVSQTTTSPVLTMPKVNCSFVPPPPLPAGSTAFTMTVTLRIHDDLGNVGEATNSGVRLLPQGSCGF